MSILLECRICYIAPCVSYCKKHLLSISGTIHWCYSASLTSATFLPDSTFCKAILQMMPNQYTCKPTSISNKVLNSEYSSGLCPNTLSTSKLQVSKYQSHYVFSSFQVFLFSAVLHVAFGDDLNNITSRQTSKEQCLQYTMINITCVCSRGHLDTCQSEHGET